MKKNQAARLVEQFGNGGATIVADGLAAAGGGGGVARAICSAEAIIRSAPAALSRHVVDPDAPMETAGEIAQIDFTEPRPSFSFTTESTHHYRGRTSITG